MYYTMNRRQTIIGAQHAAVQEQLTDQERELLGIYKELLASIRLLSAEISEVMQVPSDISEILQKLEPSLVLLNTAVTSSLFDVSSLR